MRRHAGHSAHHGCVMHYLSCGAATHAVVVGMPPRPRHYRAQQVAWHGSMASTLRTPIHPAHPSILHTPCLCLQVLTGQGVGTPCSNTH